MINITISFILGILLCAIAAWLLNRNWARRYRRRHRSLLRQARSAEKMAQLGNLTANLAHEMRNPLSIIKVNLQLLSEDINDLAKMAKQTGQFDLSSIDDPERKFQRQLRKIKTVTGEADRLRDTLNDFLRFAGRMELHLTRQNINEILDDLIDFYEPQAAQQNVQIRSSLDQSPLYCRIDIDYIKQAFLNLFINAVQAMDPDGGELMIRSSLQGNQVRIEIIDTGPGIPLADQPKVFDPYYTTRSGGTGLGLPTCRRVFEEHKGHIDLHSEPGKGTSFNIALPAANQ